MTDLEKANEDQRVLHSPFNIITHKKTFVNYLEVVIDYKGEITYAVPSHMERLIEIYMERYNVTRKEIVNKLTYYPPWEYGLDMAVWLCDKLNCICVWFDGYKGKPNQIQLNKLKTLRLSGVYHGPVHDIYEEEQERMKTIANELKEFAKNYNKEVL
jgi:hypothetical protein